MFLLGISLKSSEEFVILLEASKKNNSIVLEVSNIVTKILKLNEEYDKESNELEFIFKGQISYDLAEDKLIIAKKVEKVNLLPRQTYQFWRSFSIF